MLESPKIDRRTARKEATRAEIVEAAWALCAVEGLAGLSLRDLAAKVGMQAPSLYSYFSSKHDIYDAMFREGGSQFVAGAPDLEGLSAREGMRRMSHYFVEFCTANTVRYQLMFQRTIPGFEPSPETWAMSEAGFRPIVDFFAAHDMARPEFIDMNTALFTGIVDQQISNDPGGDRWIRLVDDAVDMFLQYVESKKKPRRSRT